MKLDAMQRTCQQQRQNLLIAQDFLQPTHACRLHKAIGTASRKRLSPSTLCKAALEFDTKVFQKEKIAFAGIDEFIYRGGRDKFQLLSRAWEDIKSITVVGWGSQVNIAVACTCSSFLIVMQSILTTDWPLQLGG